MKRILFTGGSGFIGKNIIPKLSIEFKIYSPSHRQLNLLNADKVKQYILKNKISYIIHCANVGGSREQSSIENATHQNLKMFFSLLSAVPYVKKFITMGSGAEYDKKRDLHFVPEKEFGKYMPNDEYGLAKYIISKHIKALNNKKIICLRLFGIYGPHENYLIRFISNSVVKNIFKQPIKIRQNAFFDYMYIDDLYAVVKNVIINKMNYCDYNVCTGEKISLYKIAKTVNKKSEYKSDIKILFNKKNYEYTGSNQRLLSEMPNLNLTSIEEGVCKLQKWYQKNLNKINVNNLLEDKYIDLCSERK